MTASPCLSCTTHAGCGPSDVDRCTDGGTGARAHGDSLTLDLELEAGEHRDLVLELGDEPLPHETVLPPRAWRATEASWRAAVGTPTTTLAPRPGHRSCSARTTTPVNTRCAATCLRRSCTP